MKRTPASPLLEVRALCRSYSRHRGLFGNRQDTLAAVDDVGFSLQAGEIFGLAGESGSGKSTLARLIGQLIRPDHGQILLNGEALDRMSSEASRRARQRIQLIFQDPSAALSPRRTIRQSLLEPLAHFRIGQADQHAEMAIGALQSVGLEASALARLPHQFSSGQRQRISIARALLAQPDLLIADEAVSSLDVSVQAQILELLARLREERGIACLFISHDLAVIRQLADRVGIMFQGQLVEVAPADELFSRPAHPYTRQLLDAVPDPDPRQAEAVMPIVLAIGRSERKAGCAFAERCPAVLDSCPLQRPESRPVTPGAAHRVKCHLYPLDDS